MSLTNQLATPTWDPDPVMRHDCVRMDGRDVGEYGIYGGEE